MDVGRWWLCVCVGGVGVWVGGGAFSRREPSYPQLLEAAAQSIGEELFIGAHGLLQLLVGGQRGRLDAELLQLRPEAGHVQAQLHADLVRVCERPRRRGLPRTAACAAAAAAAQPLERLLVLAHGVEGGGGEGEVEATHCSRDVRSPRRARGRLEARRGGGEEGAEGLEDLGHEEGGRGGRRLAWDGVVGGWGVGWVGGGGGGSGGDGAERWWRARLG